MNVAIALLILGWLLVGCVLMVADIHEECEWQTRAAEHDELLDRLWSDECPARPEAVSPDGRAEAS